MGVASTTTPPLAGAALFLGITMPIQFTCQNCGKVFSRPLSAKAKFCSKECRDTSYRQQALETGARVIVNCSICGKEFTAKKSEVEKGVKTCSRECRYKQTSISVSAALTGRIYKRVERACQTCGKVFTVAPSNPKLHCSRECGNQSPERKAKLQANFRRQWGNPETRQRLMAGIKKRSQSEQWQSAAHFQKGEKHPRFTGAKNRERAVAISRYQYKEWRLAVYKRDRFTCRDCGEHSRKLVAHHIKEWANHPDLRYDVSNGITLCETCHDKRHGWHRRPKTYKCVVCGKPKTDGQRPRCSSCASKQSFPAHRRAKIAKCATCGQEFKKQKKKQLYCSHKCAQTANKTQVAITCQRCSKVFMAHNYEANTREHCSRECRYPKKS